MLEYFEKIAPAGVSVKAFEHHGGEAYMTPIDSKAYQSAAKAIKETFGREPIPVRGGGSIPICSILEKELGIKIVFMGFGFAVSGIAKNESAVPPIANIITLPQFLLSGTFFSISVFRRRIISRNSYLSFVRRNASLGSRQK